jgi:riboflavin-specific deaminase-like protein
MSLDGCLAASTGDSKWIGNEENLIHAHRLRALLDAVLVGGNTVSQDNPQLNVRHVDGNNPQRFILSNHHTDFSSLKKVENTKSVLLRDITFKNNAIDPSFDTALFYKGNSEKAKFLDLLNQCKSEGVHSILVEGGARTLSAFIENKLVNVLQLHMAPILLGNGIQAVQLSNILSVNEAIKLSSPLITPLGDEFMVTTHLK